MMAAAQDMIKAIEGYKGGQGGEASHEELLAHLQRIHKEAQAGRKIAGDDSPGKREAGLAAYQREIPSERAHDGGDGQVRSNKPAPGDGAPADGPGVIAPDKGDEQGKLTRTAGVPTSGNRHANLPNPAGYPHGAAPFRTIAAGKGAIKEPARMSGGNRVSVTPPGPAASEDRVGGAPSPSKAGSDRNSGDWEKVPAYVAKEPGSAERGSSEWQRAAEGVRKLLKAPKR